MREKRLFHVARIPFLFAEYLSGFRDAVGRVGDGLRRGFRGGGGVAGRVEGGGGVQRTTDWHTQVVQSMNLRLQPNEGHRDTRGSSSAHLLGQYPIGTPEEIVRAGSRSLDVCFDGSNNYFALGFSLNVTVVYIGALHLPQTLVSRTKKRGLKLGLSWALLESHWQKKQNGMNGCSYSFGVEEPPSATNMLPTPIVLSVVKTPIPHSKRALKGSVGAARNQRRPWRCISRN